MATSRPTGDEPYLQTPEEMRVLYSPRNFNSPGQQIPYGQIQNPSTARQRGEYENLNPGKTTMSAVTPSAIAGGATVVAAGAKAAQKGMLGAKAASGMATANNAVKGATSWMKPKAATLGGKIGVNVGSAVVGSLATPAVDALTKKSMEERAARVIDYAKKKYGRTMTQQEALELLTLGGDIYANPQIGGALGGVGPSQILPRGVAETLGGREEFMAPDLYANEGNIGSDIDMIQGAMSFSPLGTAAGLGYRAAANKVLDYGYDANDEMLADLYNAKFATKDIADTAEGTYGKEAARQKFAGLGIFSGEAPGVTYTEKPVMDVNDPDSDYYRGATPRELAAMFPELRLDERFEQYNNSLPEKLRRIYNPYPGNP